MSRESRLRNGSYEYGVEPTYSISDAFSIYAGVHADRTDWLVRQVDNLIGSFEGHESSFYLPQKKTAPEGAAFRTLKPTSGCSAVATRSGRA